MTEQFPKPADADDSRGKIPIFYQETLPGIDDPYHKGEITEEESRRISGAEAMSALSAVDSATRGLTGKADLDSFAEWVKKTGGFRDKLEDVNG